MTDGRDEIVQNRNRLMLEFGQLFTEVEKLLFRHDPIDIAFSDHNDIADNPDEYAPEVGTILPRLRHANSADDVTDIVYEEFIRWFDDAETTGPKAGYEALSAEIWLAWNRFNKHSK